MMASDNSKKAFRNAVFNNNEGACKRLLDSYTFQVSFLVEMLDLCFRYGFRGAIKHLMEHGADPNTVVRGVSLVQEAAITSTDLMLQSLIGGEGQLTPELRQLRGCYYLFRKNYAIAYECFFPDATDEDWRANKKKFVDRYCDLMAQFKYARYSLSCLTNLVEHSDEDAWAQITTHLIRNTEVEFSRIRGMPLKNLFGFENTCKVLEAIVSSDRILNESPQQLLIDSVAQLIHYQIVDSLISREQQERMAKIVRRFRYKSQVMTSCYVFSLSPRYPILEFLLDMCGCDPNERDPRRGYSLTKELLWYYYRKPAQERTEDQEKVKVLLFRHGAHVCQTRYHMERTDRYWHNLDCEPRRLDCLAARLVVKSGANISGLPELIQNFVAKH